MKTYIKLAWRNLWRNKRRTMITVASVVAAVLLSAVMTSMQEGSYDNMVKNIVEFYSGHVQIHQKDYWEEKTINNSLELTDSLQTILSSNDKITVAAPRLESFALASHGDMSKGAMILGVEPTKESKITNFAKKLETGSYLKDIDNGILIAKELARYLGLKTKDTLVLISQGYHGVSAFGKFPIRGIFDHPSPELNRMLIIMEIKNCQQFFTANNLLSSITIMAQAKENLPKIMEYLQENLNKNYKAMTWEEMQLALVSQIESDRASGVIMKAILYVIIAFGILGTIMMMMAERRKEIGVMIAVGMKKFKLSIILIFETIFIGLMGVAIGIAVSIPIIWYFFEHPIKLAGKTADAMTDMGFEPVMVFSMMPKIFYNQALTILIFTLIIGIYPLVTLSRMNVIKALRS